MKIVRESLNESGSIKLDGEIYDVIKFDNHQHVYVGKNGVMGHNDVLLSWDVLKKLIEKYSR